MTSKSATRLVPAGQTGGAHNVGDASPRHCYKMGFQRARPLAGSQGQSLSFAEWFLVHPMI